LNPGITDATYDVGRADFGAGIGNPGPTRRPDNAPRKSGSHVPATPAFKSESVD